METIENVTILTMIIDYIQESFNLPLYMFIIMLLIGLLEIFLRVTYTDKKSSLIRKIIEFLLYLLDFILKDRILDDMSERKRKKWLSKKHDKKLES